MFLRIILAFISVSVLLLVVAALSFLIYHIFDDSQNIVNHQNETIIKKWLRGFSLLTTLLAIIGSIALYFLIIGGANSEQIGYKIGTVLPLLTVYFGLPYYLGYFKRGTKYILFITIIQALNFIAIFPQLLKFTILFVGAFFSCINCGAPYQTIIYESGLATLMLLILVSVIYYLINNIRLFNANRRYRKQMMTVAGGMINK